MLYLRIGVIENVHFLIYHILSKLADGREIINSHKLHFDEISLNNRVLVQLGLLQRLQLQRQTSLGSSPRQDACSLIKYSVCSLQQPRIITTQTNPSTEQDA